MAGPCCVFLQDLCCLSLSRKDVPREREGWGELARNSSGLATLMKALPGCRLLDVLTACYVLELSLWSRGEPKAGWAVRDPTRWAVSLFPISAFFSAPQEGKRYKAGS